MGLVLAQEAEGADLNKQNSKEIEGAAREAAFLFLQVKRRTGSNAPALLWHFRLRLPAG
jgi:hypothetical protein